jgi:hypothetical protein
MESRDEAAPSHRTWKTPARNRRRFPQLPQPLLLEKQREKRENQTRRPNNPILLNLTYTTPPEPFEQRDIRNRREADCLRIRGCLA